MKREKKGPVFDQRKLLGKIIEVFGTRKAFAAAMGMSERTLTQKLNGVWTWKQPEMFKAVSLLGETVSSINVLFFTLKVQKLEPRLENGRAD